MVPRGCWEAPSCSVLGLQKCHQCPHGEGSGSRSGRYCQGPGKPRGCGTGCRCLLGASQSPVPPCCPTLLLSWVPPGALSGRFNLRGFPHVQSHGGTCSEGLSVPSRLLSVWVVERMLVLRQQALSVLQGRAGRGSVVPTLLLPDNALGQIHHSAPGYTAHRQGEGFQPVSCCEGQWRHEAGHASQGC